MNESTLDLQGAARDRSSALCQHVFGALAANTEQGSVSLRAHWGMYSRFMCDGRVQDLDCVAWPPTEQQWVQFLLATRPKVSSYAYFVKILCNLCLVAVRYWSSRKQVLASSLDPRLLYRPRHRSTMWLLQRHYGLSIRQSPPITQEEAINGVYSCDQTSVRGLSMGAAWSMGASMGGRRPRTLTSIRLKHVHLRAVCAFLHARGGPEILVPELVLEYEDEKFPDYQGIRSGIDMQEMREQYCEWGINSPAYWVYKLLCLRGVFTTEDPLRAAHPGQVLVISADAMDHFLFCACSAHWWIDAQPVGVHTLSYYNKLILARMGHEPRGFSSQRSGAVTRAFILALFGSDGIGVDDKYVQSILRLGGWQCVTGAMTVFKIYARKVIDHYVDGQSLFLGRMEGRAYWQAKREQYTNCRKKPLRMFKEACSEAAPLQVRVFVTAAMHGKRICMP